MSLAPRLAVRVHAGATQSLRAVGEALLRVERAGLAGDALA